MTTFLDQRSNTLLCVCVFFPSILDIKFVGRTSRGHTTLLYSTGIKLKIEGYYFRGVSSLRYKQYSKYIKMAGYYYYCRGVLSRAAMAPPALHLRENTRGRKQGRRHEPLGRSLGGLDQQRGNGSQYNADPHLQLYSC